MTVEHHKPRQNDWAFQTQPRHRYRGAYKRIFANASRARLNKAWRELDKKQAREKA